MKAVTRYEINIASPGESPIIRYGFEGAADERLFEAATEVNADDGFARLRLDGPKYLMDDEGRTYLMAETLEELTPDTEVLDLHAALPDALPESLGNFTKLQVILAYQKEVYVEETDTDKVGS